MRRGDVVTVIGYGGVRLRRRVWSSNEYGVMACSEAEYQRASQTGEEAEAVGFPNKDVVAATRDEEVAS